MRKMSKQEKMDSIEYERSYIIRDGVISYKLTVNALYEDVSKAFLKVKDISDFSNLMFNICKELNKNGFMPVYFEIRPDFIVRKEEI